LKLRGGADDAGIDWEMLVRGTPKAKAFPPARPQIGEEARSLDELLQAIRGEYAYNTKVDLKSPCSS
jgi:hypothetical protein